MSEVGSIGILRVNYSYTVMTEIEEGLGVGMEMRDFFLGPRSIPDIKVA